MLLSQQPPAHDEALQAHAPFTHVWPVAQAVQLAPPVPHVALAEVRHCPLASQQPFGHEVTLQTHAPCALHAWPVAHALHAAPPTPHVPVPEVRHCPPESQQPLGHEAALQTHTPCALQDWPVAHAAQAAPAVPHWVADSPAYGTQALPSQQPLGHEVALQTQAPCALQTWFAAHATHCPPFAPHAVVDAVVHWPFAQQPLQLMLPQLQAPPVHVCPEAHVPQALPPDPHAVVDCADCATQRPWASQQPLGHDVGLQTQAPAGPHAWPEAQAAHVAPAVPHTPVDWPAYAMQVPFA